MTFLSPTKPNMSQMQEYYIVSIKWRWFYLDENRNWSVRARETTRQDDEENFQNNLRALEEKVNEKLAEGWVVQGTPIFDSEWTTNGGRAYQALTRTKNVQHALVVKIPEVLVAEEVKPSKTTKRRALVKE